MEFDEVFFCQEAKHNVLQMPNFCPNYCYTDHMFGIWNKKQPNMYFLGTTRPYTGAFGCIAEVNAMFVHRMITDAQFARGISDQFPAYMHRQRVTHYVQASEPDKLHVHWAGMHILRVSQVLGCELSKEGAKRHGLEKEWMTGPINALRCRIVGPYALPDAAARYRKSCEKLGTNYMYLNMIYRVWGDRLVVASWVLTLLLNAGMTWNTMNPVEQAMSAGVTYFLATKSTAMSQIRGFLLMLAFDSLYHSRAWVMLFLNVLQLLFSIVCLTQGTSFGVPLLVRLGVVTDGVSWQQASNRWLLSWNWHSTMQMTTRLSGRFRQTPWASSRESSLWIRSLESCILRRTVWCELHSYPASLLSTRRM
eukprot:symbB.v1.2.029054.t1/scaffold3141.1/size62545/4